LAWHLATLSLCFIDILNDCFLSLPIKYGIN